MTLVDTSVWIEWLQAGKRPVTRFLDRLIDEGDIVLAPVIVQELLQATRGPEQLAGLQAYFDDLPILPPSVKTYADAGAPYARCR